MKRWIWVAAAASLVSACATTEPLGGGGGSGGVSSGFVGGIGSAARPAPAPPPARFGYRMEGEGWTAQIGQDIADGEPAIDLAVRRGGVEVRADLDFGDDYLRDGVRRYEGRADTGEDVTVMLQAGLCAAGGARHAYFVELGFGAELWSGCASETGARDRWTNYLADYLPAIDLCLAEIGAAAEFVTMAYPVGAGAGVRISDRDGGRWECVTRGAGARINSLRGLDAGDVRLGEGDPVFVRGRAPAAGAGCYVYETVLDARGETIGAFGHDSCLAGQIG